MPSPELPDTKFPSTVMNASLWPPPITIPPRRTTLRRISLFGSASALGGEPIVAPGVDRLVEVVEVAPGVLDGGIPLKHIAATTTPDSDKNPVRRAPRDKIPFDRVGYERTGVEVESTSTDDVMPDHVGNNAIRTTDDRGIAQRVPA